MRDQAMREFFCNIYKISPFYLDKILVAGEDSKAEIVTLNNSQNQNCKLKEDFPPHKRGTLTAYGVLDGVPLICGGRYETNDDVYQDCLTIGSPDLTIQMLEKREWTRGIVLNYPSKLLWITGGLSEVNNHGTEHLSTEFVYLNKAPEKGPDLPSKISSHCMIKYNDSSIFIIHYYIGMLLKL